MNNTTDNDIVYVVLGPSFVSKDYQNEVDALNEANHLNNKLNNERKFKFGFILLEKYCVQAQRR
jgi:hypothetical protein